MITSFISGYAGICFIINACILKLQYTVLCIYNVVILPFFSEFKCPSLVGCTRVCDGGFRLDPEGCATCRCAPSPPSVRCSTVTMLINDQGCHCGCVMPEGDTTPRGGPRTRMMAMCPSCDDDCNTNPPGMYTVCMQVTSSPCKCCISRFSMLHTNRKAL